MCVAVAFPTIVIRHFCRLSKKGGKYKFRGSSDMHLPFKGRRGKNNSLNLFSLARAKTMTFLLLSPLSCVTIPELNLLPHNPCFPQQRNLLLTFSFPFLSTCFCAGNLFLASSYFLKEGGKAGSVPIWHTAGRGEGERNRLDFRHVPSIPKYSGGVTTMSFEEEEEEGKLGCVRWLPIKSHVTKEEGKSNGIRGGKKL